MEVVVEVVEEVVEEVAAGSGCLELVTSSPVPSGVSLSPVLSVPGPAAPPAAPPGQPAVWRPHSPPSVSSESSCDWSPATPSPWRRRRRSLCTP